MGQILIDREALVSELQKVFDARTAQTLLGVLDTVATQVLQAGVTREDFNELKRVVQRLSEAVEKLVEAQARSEARLSSVEERFSGVESRMDRVEAAIERLTQAQARSEERLSGVEERLSGVEGRMDRVEAAIERLTEAQARSEERLSRVEARLSGVEERLSGVEGRMDRVEAAIERLTEAQARSEARLERLEISSAEHRKATDRLERAIDQLRQQVGGLSETVGGDIEDIAYIVLHDVLRRELGWQVGPLERTWQHWDIEAEEVDVFGQATDPAQPGRTIWIVGEAKHNLTVREVERFSKQVERARRYLQGEVFAVCFCYRARPEVQERIRAAGLRLVFSYGKLQ
jgi:predicted nuclease with TOPRIM domain